MGNIKKAPQVKLRITQEIIDQSTERDSSHCMYAEALHAAYPNARFVSVDLQTIRFSDPVSQRRFTYLTPRMAQVGLINFDQGVKPEPHELTLRNGQVTLSGSRQRRNGDEASEAQRKQREAALRKAALANSAQVEQGAVPARIGGKTPPRSSFGKRREFGLRALGR